MQLATPVIAPTLAPKTAYTPDIVKDETTGAANAVPMTSRLMNVRRSGPMARSRSSDTPASQSPLAGSGAR